ncbi:peptidylprolyl isomerase [Bacteroidia bacterium]|nr:peptidylprolyl isomerase [Bacteroidia bacterium]
MLDEVEVVVGNKMIKHSDIEAQLNNMKLSGEIIPPNAYCVVLERLMVTKLYEHQAELDSIDISEEEIEDNMDRRIRYFIQQIGSQEKLEEYYNKPVVAIKEEFREMIRAQMVSSKMEAKITEEVKVTPSEVRKFFESTDIDSFPLIPAEYEVSVITRMPKISKEQKQIIKDKLNGYRSRILKGERFAALAILYSEDPGSAKKGGELGFFGRGEMYSEFEATAFSLKEGEISPVIETKAGFHILQLIERKGEQVNARHILLQIKPDIQELADASKFLDSVAKLIADSVYTFEEAARRFSNAPNAPTGGVYASPYTGNVKMVAEEMGQNIFFIVDKFEIGQVSKPSPFETEDREQGIQLIKLRNKTQPHKANLEDDYDKIYNIAINFERQKKMSEWTEKKIKNTYLKLSKTASDCTFEKQWKQ